MKGSLSLIFSFYLSFSVYTGIISWAAWALMGVPMHQDFWRFFPLYILFKVVTDLLIWYYLRSYNPDRLFFYANLGISERRLFISAFAIDAFIFFIFIGLVHLII